MYPMRHSFLALALSAAMLHPAWAQTPPQESPAEEYAPSVGQAGKDVIWVPTSEDLVDGMLDMAGLTADDYLVDLGSGDGRTVITAAKRGARAHGIEYNPELVELSQRAARLEGVDQRATFAQGDIFESDFSDATVVTLFLLPSLNLKLRPILLDMPPGTRVVSNSFTMDDWEPDATAEAQGSCANYCRAYKWVIPAKAEGEWTLSDGGALALTQTFQMLEGTMQRDGREEPLRDARLNGTEIVFHLGDTQYSGRVEGGAMQGTTSTGTPWRATRTGS